MNSSSVRSVSIDFLALYGLAILVLYLLVAILAFALPHTAFTADPTVYSEDVDGAPLDGTDK